MAFQNYTAEPLPKLFGWILKGLKTEEITFFTDPCPRKIPLPTDLSLSSNDKQYFIKQKNKKMKFNIKPLTKDLMDDYLFFFDNITFNENQDRLKCYCYDYHFTGDVESCTREMSRSAVINLINEDNLTGYLVFDNDKPVGWCNANNRYNYQRLLKDYDYIDNPDDKVCSIVCFLIHPDYRRQGIAQQILGKIIEDYSSKDYDYFEAYPKKAEFSCEGNFKGPLELFKKFDFKIHKEFDDYYVVRRNIK
jgi:ribosomal protein S18 acetylase RimI-like enzyme